MLCEGPPERLRRLEDGAIKFINRSAALRSVPSSKNSSALPFGRLRDKGYETLDITATQPGDRFISRIEDRGTQA